MHLENTYILIFKVIDKNVHNFGLHIHHGQIAENYLVFILIQFE